MEHELNLAVKQGDLDRVLLLLSRGTDPSAFYHNAIYLSIAHGHVDIAKVLLATGNTSIRWAGMYALWSASERGHTDTVRFTLDEHKRIGRRFSMFHRAVALLLALSKGHGRTALVII